jgi:hypothetical protein
MSGFPENNRIAFHAAERDLREIFQKEATGKFLIVNPAKLDAIDAIDAGPLEWSSLLRRDIAELVKCDAIIMLPGHENSKGAALELHIARKLDFEIWRNLQDVYNWCQAQPIRTTTGG